MDIVIFEDVSFITSAVIFIVVGMIGGGIGYFLIGAIDHD